MISNNFSLDQNFRDLNYNKFVQNDAPPLISDEYNSHNTERLNLEQLKKLLLTLDEVNYELKNFSK